VDKGSDFEIAIVVLRGWEGFLLRGEPDLEIRFRSGELALAGLEHSGEMRTGGKEGVLSSRVWIWGVSTGFRGSGERVLALCSSNGVGYLDIVVAA